MFLLTPVAPHKFAIYANILLINLTFWQKPFIFLFLSGSGYTAQIFFPSNTYQRHLPQREARFK